MKLLLEAGPLVAFLLVYWQFDIYSATAVLVLASVLSLGLGHWLDGRFSRLSIFTVAVSVVLGGLTVFLHDPRFIQVKPTVVFAAFALALGGSHFIGDKVALQSLFGRVLPLPDVLWRRINALWAVYFAIHAVLNIYVATRYSLQTWVLFKVFGFGLATVVFGALHVPFLWRQLRAARARPM